MIGKIIQSTTTIFVGKENNMIHVARPNIDDQEVNAAIEVLKSGNYTSGSINGKFEEEFAKYCDTDFAASCNSGTAAIHMVLLALGIGPGDEVIVPSISFFATVSPILMVGAEPVFCDVELYGNMSANSAETYITEKTKAIIPVHLHGRPCNMTEIMQLARRYNLFVIEDCAQAHGAEFQNRKVGSFGDAGCFSFFATKNMTTIEGGMVTTNNPRIDEMCRLYRSHGMINRDEHAVLGYNYRLNELSAAIGRIQLKKLDDFNKKRRENSLTIYNMVKKESLKFPRVQPIYNHVYFWCPVYTEAAWVMDMLKSHLKRNGIGFRSRYSVPMYKQPIFKNKYYNVKNRVAETFCKNVIGMPNHPGITKDELDKVISVMEAFN